MINPDVMPLWFAIPTFALTCAAWVTSEARARRRMRR